MSHQETFAALVRTTGSPTTHPEALLHISMDEAKYFDRASDVVLRMLLLVQS